MNQEIKDKWTEMVYDEALNTPTEWLYILLNPTDKREFFKIVGTIIEQHMPKDEDNGYTTNNETQIWASSYITKFKMTAVEYLIGLENDNNKISTPVQPDTITWKTYPVQPDTIPWKPDIVYYTNYTTTETK